MQKAPESQEVVESPPRDPSVGFDLRVEIFDSRTGRLIKHQPYVRHSHRERGVVYERGGKYFYENGQEADVKDWGFEKPQKFDAKVAQGKQ